MQPSRSKAWKVKEAFFKASSPWLTIFGEKVTDHEGTDLDYWRIEKADSVIALTLQGDHFVLPPKEFRPGISNATLDFPGGRVIEGRSPEKAIRAVICRELDITPADIIDIMPLNENGWHINSSFSNQHLFGYVAKINENVRFEKGIQQFPTTFEGTECLLHEIKCLQCRAVLLEWLMRRRY